MDDRVAPPGSAHHRITQYLAGLAPVSGIPLRVALWNGMQHDLGPQPRVTVHLPDPAALRYFVPPSLDNLAEGYVNGHFDVLGKAADIVEAATSLATHGVPMRGRFGRLFSALRHDRGQDAHAIAHHYDVSNDFYRLWLDEAMVYSCAYFPTRTESLAAAQSAKLDHILNKLMLKPGERLLDIGCGWGALVLRAAQQYGAQCVGVTLSKNQYELARERVHAAGLQDRIQIRLQDYRDVSDGPFDRITSVGMFEHVGLDHLASYFGHIRRLLKPDGWVMNHGITSTDACDGETRHGGGHFIDRYVFPRGELPHIGTVLRTLQEGGLEAFDVENLRRHYQRTTQLWSEAFEANTARIKPLLDEKRWRIWRIYLAGCALAFENDEVALYQVLCRPAGQGTKGLPWSRNWMYGA